MKIQLKHSQAVFVKKFCKIIEEFDEINESERIERISQLFSLESIPLKHAFLTPEIEYTPFPFVEKKISVIVGLLKAYLKPIDNEESENNRKINNFVLAMMRDSCTIDVFYFLFLKYLSNEQISEHDSNGMILFNDLVQTISELAKHCSEKDLAAGIGYFMDVLSWDTRETPKNFESISLYSIKKNILDILKRNILNNIYFPPYMLYEIAKREKDLYKKEKYFDYCLNMFKDTEGQNTHKISPIAKNINGAYKLQIKASIYFELMQNYHDNNELEQFYICLSDIRKLIVDLSDAKMPDLSFMLSNKNHDHVIKEIEKSITYFDLQKLSDLHEIEPEQLLKRFKLFKTYIYVLESIISQCEYFQRLHVKFKMTSVNLDLSEIQGFSRRIAADISTVLDKINEKIQSSVLDAQEFSNETNRIRAKVSSLRNKVDHSLNAIKEPYYAAFRQYILDSVPEDFSQDFIDESHTKNNNISFSLKSCRDTSKIIQEYGTMVSLNAGVLTLDLNNIDISMDVITKIVNKIYLIKKSIRDQQSRIEAEKSKMHKPFSALSLQAPPTSSESEVNVLKISEVNDALIFTESKSEKASKQHVRSKVAQPNPRKPKRQGKKLNVNAKVEIKAEDNKQNKLLAKAVKYLEPENNVDTLITAKDYSLGFVLNSNMGKSVIVAINKNLVDQDGKDLPEINQEKINDFSKNLLFARKFGQDGIKRYNQTYHLKVRHVGDKSYRAKPSEVKSVDKDLILVKYDKVIEKNKVKRR